MTGTTTAGFTASSISKRYGQTAALDEVTVTLVPGEVAALVGHNGAGKSTLLKMLAGAETPDQGSLLLDGVPQHFSAPADALAAGVACVYQELRLVNQLTVAQNVFLGRESTRRGRLARPEMNRRTAELFRGYGIAVSPTARAGDLSVAQRQMVEVIAALNRNAHSRRPRWPEQALTSWPSAAGRTPSPRPPRCIRESRRSPTTSATMTGTKGFSAPTRPTIPDCGQWRRPDHPATAPPRRTIGRAHRMSR